MKFTITNNGTCPLSVLYTDLFKIYTKSDDGLVGDIVTLEPDTSITLDNVEAVHQIAPGPELLSQKDLDDLDLDGDDLDSLDLEDDDDEDGNLLSQEDFDLNELDSDRTPP